MSFFLIIWRNLWRRRTRSLLTAAGVAVGVAAGVAMAALAWGFQGSVDRTYTARGTDMVVARITSHNPMPTVFGQECAPEVAVLPGVRAVAKADWEYLAIDGGPSTVVYGWEPGSYLWEHLSLKEGAVGTGAEVGSSIYLGALCAEMLGKKLGDTVRIEQRELRVAGIFQSEALLENGAAILPLGVFQSILGRDGKVKHLNLRLQPGLTAEQFEELRQTIQRRFRGLKAFHSGEVARNSTGVQIAKAMSLATSLIALLIGTLGMMNTLLMSVFERISEIGLLMAVGWRRRRVLAMILLESLVLSLAGAVIGVTVGVVGVRALQTMEFMRGRFEGEFSLGLIGAAFAIATGLGILGGLYPAARAASMQPQAALRSE